MRHCLFQKLEGNGWFYGSDGVRRLHTHTHTHTYAHACDMTHYVTMYVCDGCMCVCVGVFEREMRVCLCVRVCV